MAPTSWIVRPGLEIQRAKEASRFIGADIDPRAQMSSLKQIEKQLVVIARAVANGCELLALDEPSASLSEVDVDRLFATMVTLRERGVGLVFVSHRIDEVFQVTDRVAVMRDGARVHDERIDDSSPDEVFAHIAGDAAA